MIQSQLDTKRKSWIMDIEILRPTVSTIMSGDKLCNVESKLGHEPFLISSLAKTKVE